MQLNINKKIDTVYGITREEFEKKYYYPQKPVVIKGLMDEYPAHKKWNFQFFKDEMGDFEVGIFDASLESLDRSYKMPHYKMPFRDYLNEIESGPTKKRLFLFNAFKHNPALLDDFEFPKLCGGFLKSFPFMFFGGDSSITRIHQDMDMSCVFLTQFVGKKKAILFDPKYSSLLYRYPLNVHTGIEVNEPDFERFPGLKFVEGEEAILEFGDTLFMPSGWWHHIEYIGSGFSMSMRCFSPYVKDWIKGTLNVAVKTNIDDLMRKIAGNSWFSYKERKAFERAKNSIDKLEKLKVF